MKRGRRKILEIQTDDEQEVHGRGKVRREEDGKRDRGEMRGAIARWTPEGRVYFDNRYHRRRCYRLSYRSATHTVNGRQIERCVCLCAYSVCVLCRDAYFHDADSRASSSFTISLFLFILHLSFFLPEPAFKPLCGYYITNDSFPRTRERASEGEGENYLIE